MSGAGANPILEVRGLEKEYPGVRALQGVDFDVLPGEVHCLLGPNGAGKSTLIKCVSGAVEPTRGEILVSCRACATTPAGWRRSTPCWRSPCWAWRPRSGGATSVARRAAARARPRRPEAAARTRGRAR